MSGLADTAQDYLLIRRALGFKLERHARLLPDFVTFLDDAGASFVTTDLALRWATQPAGSATWWAERLSVVRGFARHLATIDARTQVPPAGLLKRPGPARRRAVPYLYSSQDIVALMNAARELRPLQAATYETLIGLLAVGGLRAGEVIRLDRDDLDDERSVLIIRDTKFGKSRLVPLHESTLAALHGYLRRRDELCPQAVSGPSLFISTTGTRLLYKVVQPTFARLCNRAGLRPRSPRCRPTLHGLRHSLAVTTLLDWYRSDADIDALLPRLSTFLGHVDPASTYWYLHTSPELLTAAAARLQHAAGDLS